MIQFGKQIRLTAMEVDRVTEITGIKPVGVKTIEDLNAYIASCKHYWGGEKETKFLDWFVGKALRVA